VRRGPARGPGCPGSAPSPSSGLALLLRRPLLLAVGAGLLASSLAVAAWAGLSPPASRSVDGVAVLVGDPGEVHGAVRVDVRLGRRRYEAWARGTAAAVLRDRLAGELVRLRGRVRPPSPDDRHWLAPRHVVAQLDVDAVDGWRAGNLATRSANAVRRTLNPGRSTAARRRAEPAPRCGAR